MEVLVLFLFKTYKNKKEICNITFAVSLYSIQVLKIFIHRIALKPIRRENILNDQILSLLLVCSRMKFGEQLSRQAHPAYQNYYLNYGALKSAVKYNP